MGFAISAEIIDVHALSQAMQTPAAGAFTSFAGWVRNHHNGRVVTALEYEVFHVLALSEGEKIIAEALAKFEIIAVQAVHREGQAPVGECAVWVGVTATHRDAAFAACRYVIDEIKLRLPIWKKEFYADGSAPVWVNCQGHQT